MQTLMRHARISTTMSFYVASTAKESNKDLWHAEGSESGSITQESEREADAVNRT
jgi:hypothetical protein